MTYINRVNGGGRVNWSQQSLNAVADSINKHSHHGPKSGITIDNSDSGYIEALYIYAGPLLKGDIVEIALREDYNSGYLEKVSCPVIVGCITGKAITSYNHYYAKVLQDVNEQGGDVQMVLCGILNSSVKIPISKFDDERIFHQKEEDIADRRVYTGNRVFQMPHAIMGTGDTTMYRIGNSGFGYVTSFDEEFVTVAIDQFGSSDINKAYIPQANTDNVTIEVDDIRIHSLYFSQRTVSVPVKYQNGSSNAVFYQYVPHTYELIETKSKTFSIKDFVNSSSLQGRRYVNLDITMSKGSGYSTPAFEIGDLYLGNYGHDVRHSKTEITLCTHEINWGTDNVFGMLVFNAKKIGEYPRHIWFDNTAIDSAPILPE